MLATAAVATAQLGAWWVYQRVEGGRHSDMTAAEPEYERLESERGPLDAVLQRPDGSMEALRNYYDQPVLVHFWATWCAPCRLELPKLLQLEREGRIRFLLVSTDESWAVVQHFFGQEVPASVVLDTTGGARQAFGVSSLPDTYLLARGGRPVARFHGARDWSAEAVRKQLLSLAR